MAIHAVAHGHYDGDFGDQGGVVGGPGVEGETGADGAGRFEDLGEEAVFEVDFGRATGWGPADGVGLVDEAGDPGDALEGGARVFWGHVVGREWKWGCWWRCWKERRDK